MPPDHEFEHLNPPLDTVDADTDFHDRLDVERLGELLVDLQQFLAVGVEHIAKPVSPVPPLFNVPVLAHSSSTSAPNPAMCVFNIGYRKKERREFSPNRPIRVTRIS
jgi:hypothetical protein